MVVIEAFFSILLGIILLASSVPKLRHPRGFVLTVLEYRILPPLTGRIYGWSLPLLEFLLALLLLSGTNIRLTSVALSFLLLSFIIAISINVARGRDLNCNCFGTKRQRKIGWGLLLQDFVLFGAACILSTLPPVWISVASWSLLRLFLPLPLSLINALASILCFGATIGVATVLRRTPRQVYNDVQRTKVSWHSLQKKQ